ncbi:MAG TPA: NADH-quinone oxidoreductase subunit NuoH [Thermoanaerobaculia bacterium]|nr:NADH-quinone oxidoreductase subunit NuoH [Thermoanaerobaculia bacterium]
MSDLLVTGAKLLVFLGVFLGAIAPIMVWLERRFCAFIQDRPGPNRLGPLGLFQPLADVFKFFFKEDVTPSTPDRALYLAAPALAVLPALVTFVFIPFGPTVEIGERLVPLIVSDAPAGVLLLLAIASLSVYSLVLAGYASNNKYSLMGGIRASAQLISYELAMTLAVVAVLLPVGSFHLSDVITYQQENGWNVLPQAIGFLVFLIAMFAETNRLPFDLPEAESELVAGFHTEYSAMRFASFFMSEYIAMTTLSALAATLYFGGWDLWGIDDWLVSTGSGLFLPEWFWAGAVGMTILVAKAFVFLLLFIWVRWTFPRFRYDQLMRLGWKVLLPLALFNVVLIAALTVGGVL